MLRAWARVSPASRIGRWAPLRCAIGWWLALAWRRGCRAGPASPLLWLLPTPTVPPCPSRLTTAKPARSLSPAPAGAPAPPPAPWPAIRAATQRLASTPGCTGIGSAGARAAWRRRPSSSSCWRCRPGSCTAIAWPVINGLIRPIRCASIRPLSRVNQVESAPQPDCRRTGPVAPAGSCHQASAGSLVIHPLPDGPGESGRRAAGSRQGAGAQCLHRVPLRCRGAAAPGHPGGLRGASRCAGGVPPSGRALCGLPRQSPGE